MGGGCVDESPARNIRAYKLLLHHTCCLAQHIRTVCRSRHRMGIRRTCTTNIMMVFLNCDYEWGGARMVGGKWKIIVDVG